MARPRPARVPGLLLHAICTDEDPMPQTTKVLSALCTVAALTVLQGCQPDDATTAPAGRTVAVSALVTGPSGIKQVVTGRGEIEPALDQFRALLGGALNTTPGPFATGRREINWDGVPATLTNNDLFPGDFFNLTDPAGPAGRKRGAVFTTSGTGFRVSDNDFADVNPTYGEQFEFFSPVRTFSQVGSNVMDVRFRVPGTNTPAAVNGFGAVFPDVDRALITSLTYFDRNGRQIAKAFAPVRRNPDEYTFAGVVFNGAAVARVRIVLGEAALGATVNDVSSGGTRDLVIMDDFLYGEPQPLP